VRADGSSSVALSEETLGKRDREQQALIDEAQWEARCLIVDHRELLDELAASLLANETLDRAEINKILAASGVGQTAKSADSAKSAEVVPADGDHTEDDADDVAEPTLNGAAVLTRLEGLGNSVAPPRRNGSAPPPRPAAKAS